MTEAPPLSAGIQEFIESMGLYYEQYDLPRIGGRILGLLMVSSRPLSLDDMATALQVSRASISTNVRQAVLLGMARQVSLTGDRRDYYRFVDDAWERTLLERTEGVLVLKRMAVRGLAALGPEDDALDRSRLEELEDFCDFLIEEMPVLSARWHARRQAGRTRNRRFAPPPADAREPLGVAEDSGVAGTAEASAP